MQTRKLYIKVREPRGAGQSASVISLRISSSATFALDPPHGLQGKPLPGQWAEWFFRFIILNRLSNKSIHLNNWS